MVTITIGADPFASNELVSTPTTESDISSDGNILERGESPTDGDTDLYTVRVSMIRKDPVWDDFMSYVEKAKARAATDTTEWPGSKVYVDFDPRADLGQGQVEPDISGLSSLQISVCRALGLDTTAPFFSKWRYIYLMTCI